MTVLLPSGRLADEVEADGLPRFVDRARACVEACDRSAVAAARAAGAKAEAGDQRRRWPATERAGSGCAGANNRAGRLRFVALLDHLADLRRCGRHGSDRDHDRASFHRAGCQSVAAAVGQYFGNSVANVRGRSALTVG